jgi:ribosomal protein L16 Arg81 hydroxylase
MNFSSFGFDHEKTIDSILGGDHSHFFNEIWQQKTAIFKGCLPELINYYSISQFMNDYNKLDYHQQTLLTGIEGGDRKTLYRESINNDVIREQLARNYSMVVQPLNIPESEGELPKQWRWFLAFYDVMTRYALPDFPVRNHFSWLCSGPDMFLNMTGSSVGGHYDSGDVFYFVLEGQKEWEVEKTPNLERARELNAAGELTLSDLQGKNESERIILEAGDCLYVPAFTYHRVSSQGPSLAVSIGLPNFREEAFIKYALAQLKLPVKTFDSFPTRFLKLNEQARQKNKERLKTVFDKIYELY